MKKFISLLIFLPFFVYSANTNDTEKYKEGKEFGSNIKPNLNDIKNFDTNKFIEGGINSNPEQTKYYNGVNTKGDNLTGDGANKFNQSELKKPIIDSIKNKPNLTKDDQIIADSLEMQNGITKDDKGNFCIPTVTHLTSPIDQKKSCLQDKEYGYCKLKPNITWKTESTSYEEYTETIKLYPNLDKSNSKLAYFEFTPKHNGKLLKASIKYKQDKYLGAYFGRNHRYSLIYIGEESVVYNVFNRTRTIHNFFGKSIFITSQTPGEYQFIIKDKDDNNNYYQDVDGTQVMTMNLEFSAYRREPHSRADGVLEQDHFAENFMCKSEPCREVFITYTILVEHKHQSPVIEWYRECDFDFKNNQRIDIKSYNIPNSSQNYKMIKNECSIKDAEREFVDETGKSHFIKLSCFEFDETYEKKVDISPSCEILNNDRSCTQLKQVCTIYDEKNNCTQYSIEYSCETSRKEGIQCGQLFYTNCETEECKAKHNNEDFGDTASKLQMVTEAAKNINEDPENIRIFSGKSLSCRKAMAGYNNCCSDSGWGQNIGIAGCNNEEKELGGAKEKGLTIPVGEYCSKKVLGVCLQKKRSYCVFNSKLAKIVQKQGRNDQLRIGFGSKKHPDCRGLTLEEFERINFDAVNFDEFYNDLNNQIDIPTEEALKSKVKRQ